MARNITTEDDINRALADAAASEPSACATSAVYDRRLDLVIVKIDDGRRLVIARELLQGLEDATQSQLAHIEIFSGVDIAWPDLDVDHYLPHLLEGRYSTAKWQQEQRLKRQAA